MPEKFQAKLSFKTWVFAIAINTIKDSQRANKKWEENWRALGKDHNQENQHILAEKVNHSVTSEQGKFVIREHINFCFTCITKPFC